MPQKQSRSQNKVAPGVVDRFEMADDRLAGLLWRIAVATGTRIGFESVEFVRPWGGLKDVPAFPISSRDEALKATVDADPRYEWRAIGGFVVVRPKMLSSYTRNSCVSSVVVIQASGSMEADVDHMQTIRVHGTR